MDGDRERQIRALEASPPDEEPSDLYDEVDVSELPTWWQSAIEEFEAHGLRPYRPPQFEDGEPVHESVEEIEREWDVQIRFIAFGVDDGDDWEIRIEGNRFGEIGHHRSPDGHSVFEMERDAFVDYVESALHDAQ